MLRCVFVGVRVFTVQKKIKTTMSLASLDSTVNRQKGGLHTKLTIFFAGEEKGKADMVDYKSR